MPLSPFLNEPSYTPGPETGRRQTLQLRLLSRSVNSFVLRTHPMNDLPKPMLMPYYGVQPFLSLAGARKRWLSSS